MTTTDWIIDVVLVLIVLRQVRWAAIDLKFVLIPAGIVYFVCKNYLHSLPSGGNDLLLVGGATVAGTLLGLVGGLVTQVAVRDGVPHARAGVFAASLWVGSMSARLGMIIWITHTAGEHTIERFSVAHHITSGAVWQDALVMLAMGEVVVRIGTIMLRGMLAKSRDDAAQTEVPLLVRA